MTFNIYSYRRYGEPKLPKPKELKGINQSFSVDYISKKCRCQVFIKGNDVWVKHRDYFSSIIPPEPHELDMPLNYFCEKYMGKNRQAKFVYEDAWGSVVARNEAWIRIDDLMLDIKNKVFILDIVNEICRQQERYHGLKEYGLCCTDMERMWEGVIKALLV